MTKEEIIKYVKQGDEIELDYNNKKFSITYGEFDGEDMISFCEFYKETSKDDDITLSIRNQPGNSNTGLPGFWCINELI